MPDVTVSFTDAQWARIVAASKQLKAPNEDGDVDVAYIAAKWKSAMSREVNRYEESLVSADEF